MDEAFSYGIAKVVGNADAVPEVLNALSHDQGGELGASPLATAQMVLSRLSLMGEYSVEVYRRRDRPLRRPFRGL
jgi:hypothetical protein